MGLDLGWLCTRVALRFPLSRGGQGGVKKTQAGLVFYSPAALRHPLVRGGSLPGERMQNGSAYFISACSMIQLAILSGSFLTSPSFTRMILNPSACICLSRSASCSCASAEKCDLPGTSMLSTLPPDTWRCSSPRKCRSPPACLGRRCDHPCRRPRDPCR